MLTAGTASSFPDLALRPPQGGPTPAAAPAGREDFAGLLARLASDTASAVQQGEAAAIAGVQGSMPMQTVVEKVMAAERTLQAALAVRDKAVSAYQEISRMQI